MSSASIVMPPTSGRRNPRRKRLGGLRTPLGLSSLVLLSAVLLLAAFGPVIWGEAAETIDTNALSMGPSAEHWLGTDDLGRDLFARVMVATRLSVMLALLSTTIGVSLGILLGTVPWLLGPRFGGWATAFVNIAVAFPSLLMALFFAVIFGVGAIGAVLAIGLSAAPTFARLTQTLVAGVESRDYIAAARVLGLRRPRVLVKHVLPNIGEPLVVTATINAGGALLAFAGLSFLGLGVQAPGYDWGVLLDQGVDGIYLRPIGALAPGIAIIIAGLAFNLFGEAIAKGIGVQTSGLGSLSGKRSPKRLSQLPTTSEKQEAAQTNDAEINAAQEEDAVLVVEDLNVFLGVGLGQTAIVEGVSFRINRGESIGIVGESGSGKSLTALAISRLLEDPVESRARKLEFLGQDISGDFTPETRKLLGLHLGLVFQDPTTSFNPTMRLNEQLSEAAKLHQGLATRAVHELVVQRLGEVGIADAQRRAKQYPHEFSGGMRQRAMIAQSLMVSPALIIADEPTTALDVTVQQQILELIAEQQHERGTAILMISHDLAVVAQVCDRVLVMYAGRVVEDLPSSELRDHARHPYTRALLATVPSPDPDRTKAMAVIPGNPVSPSQRPSGCAFAPRCALADEHCRAQVPPLESDSAGRRVACWKAEPGIQHPEIAGAFA